MSTTEFAKDKSFEFFHGFLAVFVLLFENLVPPHILSRTLPIYFPIYKEVFNKPDVLACQGLSNLASIDLSFNRLTSLPPAVFNGLNSLTMLHLTGNAPRRWLCCTLQVTLGANDFVTPYK